MFSLLYVVLVSRQIIWCWACNLLGTMLAGVVFYFSELYLLVLLQIYYCGVALYGWVSWARAGPAKDSKAIRRLVASRRLLVLGGIVMLACTSLLVASLLGQPMRWVLIAEHLSTWMAVFAMLLAARKYIENWVLWICTNTLYISIFLDSSLYGYAGLNLLFIVTSLYGLWTWRKHLSALPPLTAPPRRPPLSRG